MSRVRLDAKNYCHQPMPGGEVLEEAIAIAAKGGASALLAHLAGRRLEELRAGYGLTVLHALARPRSGTSTDQRALAAILRVGIDIDAVDNKGQTALHRAAATGSWWMIASLMKHGADASLVAINKWDVFSFANKRLAAKPEEEHNRLLLRRILAERECELLEQETPQIASPVRRSGPRL